MLRRVLALLLAAALTLGLCGCAAESSDYPYYDMKRVGVEDYNHFPRTIMDLEACPLIVRATAQKSAESYSDTLETVVPITVTKVFQDTISGVKEGDTLRLVEPYGVRGHLFWKKLVAKQGIMPSEAGTEYIYFLQAGWLSKDPNQMALYALIPYCVTEGPFCRFPWTDGRELSWEEIPDRVKGMTNRELYLRADVPLDEETMYRDLYALVIEAYMQSIPCAIIQID